jgi:hypothetical protein
VDWQDAEPDADSRRLDLRFSPASSDGFLLGAKPAFPFARVDLGLVVVALSRHVVDALAAGADVALDAITWAGLGVALPPPIKILGPFGIFGRGYFRPTLSGARG